jgi:uncharacterized protein with PQ loop repeat
MSVIFYDYNNSLLDETKNQILIDVFGYVSGVLVGITLMPQVYKTLKNKTAKHLSFKFLIVSLVASISKIVYGVLINQLPIVITAPIILCETLIIMIAKAIFDAREKKQEEEDNKEGHEKDKEKHHQEIEMKIRKMNTGSDIYNYNSRDLDLEEGKVTMELKYTSSDEESV